MLQMHVIMSDPELLGLFEIITFTCGMHAVRPANLGHMLL
jgi:hypothetical protein